MEERRNTGKTKKRIIGLFLLSIALVAGIRLAGSDLFRAQVYFIRGNFYSSHGEYQRAYECYVRAENTYPTLEISERAKADIAYNFLLWGEDCAKQGQYGEADNYFRQALDRRHYLTEDESNDVEASLVVNLLSLGKSYSGLGRYEEAEQVLGEALEKSSFLTEEQSENLKNAMIANCLAHTAWLLSGDQPYEAVEILDETIARTGSEQLKEKRMDIIEKTVIAAETAPSSATAEFDYDEYGNVVEYRYYNSSGILVCRKKYQDGKPLFIESFSNFDGKREEILEFEYDENNELREVRYLSYDKNGYTTERDLYQYKNGKLAKLTEQILDPSGNIIEENSYYETVFDEVSGLLTEKIYPDISKTVFLYDESGNCIKEQDYTFDEQGLLRKSGEKESSFDENGNLILECSYDENDRLYWRKEYTYKEAVLQRKESWSYSYDSVDDGKFFMQQSDDEEKKTLIILREEETYDEAGHTTLLLNYRAVVRPDEDVEWVLSRRQEKIYDENGNCISASYFSEYNLVLDDQMIYNERGQIQERTSWHNGVKSAYANWKYDEYGILREKYEENYRAAEADSEEIITEKIVIKYDLFGTQLSDRSYTYHYVPGMKN